MPNTLSKRSSRPGRQNRHHIHVDGIAPDREFRETTFEIDMSKYVGVTDALADKFNRFIDGMDLERTRVQITFEAVVPPVGGSDV